jgi:hypothetical protein
MRTHHIATLCGQESMVRERETSFGDGWEVEAEDGIGEG